MDWNSDNGNWGSTNKLSDNKWTIRQLDRTILENTQPTEVDETVREHVLTHWSLSGENNKGIKCKKWYEAVNKNR